MQDLIDVTPEQAAQEILRRRKARDSLIDFACYTQPSYVPDPFHHLLADRLEKVERGEIDRLMIFTPPRHGKSELASIKFPAYFMARNKGANVIQASYNLDQATRSSRFTRNIIQSEEFGRVFRDTHIASDSRAADRWQLDNGQEYFAVGVGTGATGKGAHLFIIDDPLKDREEADSETRRQTIWDWYNDVVYTRLESGGRIIIIQTRWHFDDLGGRLIKAMKDNEEADQWHILNLPALIETEEDERNDPLGRKIGEPLAPNRKSAAELIRIKNNTAERTWSALFQQRPISSDGSIFNPKWFDVVDRVPINKNKVRAWDLASTIKGDFTVGCLMSRDANGSFYVEDIKRFRGKPLEVEQTILETAQADGRLVEIRIPQDPGQAGVAQSQHLIRKLAGYVVKAVRPTGPKETRAAAFAAQAEAGNVKLKVGGWNKAFLDELSVFPLGSNDDQVDSASDSFNALLGPARARILEW